MKNPHRDSSDEKHQLNKIWYWKNNYIGIQYNAWHWVSLITPGMGILPKRNKKTGLLQQKRKNILVLPWTTYSA